MRLIGIGLLAFLLAGIALFLSNTETLRLGARTLSEVALGPRLAFETTASPHTALSRGAVVYRAGQNAPLILSGLPAYQSAAFYMPIDARPTSGHLQIDTTVQALAGIEGVLRVSIGNTKRAELLLRPGEAGRSLRIQLTDADIAREQLVVSFSLQGKGTHTSCAIDEGVEVIVEIEATSAIFLELDRPLVSPRDQALANGRRIAVSWSNNANSAALLAGRKLHLSGVEPLFANDGVLPAQAFEVSDYFAAVASRPRFAWEKALSSNAPLFGARRFHRSQTWKMHYDMSDGEMPSLPDRFDLNMILGHQSNGAAWHVLVTLNGKHLYDGFNQAGSAALSLAMPSDNHRLQNTIEITLASTMDTPSVCNHGPELVAEILESTKLLPGRQSFNDPLIDVVGALKDGWQLSSETVSSAEATVAARLLAELPDPKQGQAPKTVVHVLARGADLSGWPDASKDAMVFYFNDLGVPTVQTIASYPRQFTAQVAVLINFNGAGS